ncbi:MAG: DUF1836 domain-containing protein [Epulopiscium sp.]|nr:DUF1836 domain-containing protein [Candidatus Epulonipiscium sp.]
MNIKILELLDEICSHEEIEVRDIPMLDLYMDQVITLFESKLEARKRYEDDKLLTKTMINNYVKDKILKPATNKKYSPEHLIMMALIYNLKQILSIGDIKTLFTETIYKEGIDVFDLYQRFLEVKKEDKIQIKQSVTEKLETLDLEQSKEEDIIIMVLSLINSANIQKRLAEEIIDNYLVGESVK